ncbi:ABC transporter ATP-binding protein [soil metagenome]
MKAGLRLTDARVTYRDDDGTTGVAVDAISFEVAPGEVLALLGASGSGKSTLLRAIAGLEPLERGSVAWNGVDLAAIPVHRRGFALMFQDGQLFPHRDVFANVAYPLRLRNQSTDRVAHLLELVGLPGFERRRIATLSGGEQQRVALARALAASPQLLLLDEPLSALDRELRERLATDLRAILTTTATTAIFVTHDQSEAFAIADRVGIMQKGQLVQLGTPTQVWRAPASADVARFLGYSSIVTDALGLVGSNALRATALAVVADGAPDSIAATVVRSVPSLEGDRIRVLIDGVGEFEAVGVGEPGERVRLSLDARGVARL